MGCINWKRTAHNKHLDFDRDRADVAGHTIEGM